MSIRNILEEAAQEAVSTLQVDLAAAEARAARKQRNLRAVLAAAAAAALVALAVPALVLLPSPAPPAAPEVTGPQGLPEYWYSAPESAPPVTRAPMQAASLVLQSPGGYPVLVSSDARTYATLPDWGRKDGFVALSPDGRKVAWVTDGAPVTVHIVELATGRRTDVEIADQKNRVGAYGTATDQVVWIEGRLYVRNWGLLWQFDGDRMTSLGQCHDLIGRDGDGRPILLSALDSNDDGEPCPLPGANSVTVATTPSGPEPPAGRKLPVASPLAVGSPVTTRTEKVKDGLFVKDLRGVVTAVQDGAVGRLTFGGDAPRDVVGLGDTVAVMPLAWTKAGVLVRIDEGTPGNTDRALRLVDPKGASSRAVSRGMESAAPVAVAPDLIGIGTPIPAVAPRFPDRDPVRHGLDAVLHAWVPTRTAAWVGAVLAAVVVLLVVRRRRRRESVLRG